ncbi:HAAS signaling domain-containing protein [Glutamicibacter sp.]|uniref:HAAS signaling domain-containing protein n=1 Tax=Glutamicibacter sp. TaxID=1931995 RepID=UPI0028BE03AA|nr:hypothetical protein [Glutamicibacter sp.]
MKSYLPRAARNYLEQLRRELSFLTDAERQEILDHTREQILKLPGKGRRKSDLYRLLGEPQALAAGFARTEPQELKVSSGRQFLSRILAWPIFALAVLTAALIVLSPSSMTLVEPRITGYVEGSWQGTLTQLELNMGSYILLFALIPVVFSLLPLVLRGTLGLIIQLLGALATTAVSLIGVNSLGAFFIPLAVLLWAQVFTPLLMMRGSMASPGPGWLISAAVVLIGAVAATTLLGLRSFSGEPWLVVAPAALLVVLAVLLPFRWRWANIGLISAGVLVMIAGCVASLESMYQAPLVWPWLAGSMSFAVGHLALAAGMWHERARNLLALL